MVEVEVGVGDVVGVVVGVVVEVGVGVGVEVGVGVGVILSIQSECDRFVKELKRRLK